MARKLGLLCVFCSIAYCMFTQQKSDYTNINDFVNKMVNNSKTVEESIKRYGEPLSTEQRLAKEFSKDFFANASEEAVLLFHNYKNARFVFFIDKEKHFLTFWEITGNFAEFSPFLSNNMTINDVKKVFGENIAVPTEDGVRYGADRGNVWFSFIDDCLISVSWASGV